MELVDLYIDYSTTAAQTSSLLESRLDVSLDDLESCEWVFQRQFYPVNTFLWHQQTPAGKEMRRRLLDYFSSSPLEITG